MQNESDKHRTGKDIETVWSAKQILITGEILEMVKERRKLKDRIITEYKIN